MGILEISNKHSVETDCNFNTFGEMSNAISSLDRVLEILVEEKQESSLKKELKVLTSQEEKLNNSIKEKQKFLISKRKELELLDSESKSVNAKIANLEKEKRKLQLLEFEKGYQEVQKQQQFEKKLKVFSDSLIAYMDGRHLVIDSCVWMDLNADSFLKYIEKVFLKNNWRFTMFHAQYEEILYKRSRSESFSVENGMCCTALRRIRHFQNIGILDFDGLSHSSSNNHFDKFLNKMIKNNNYKRIFLITLDVDFAIRAEFLSKHGDNVVMLDREIVEMANAIVG